MRFTDHFKIELRNSSFQCNQGLARIESKKNKIEAITKAARDDVYVETAFINWEILQGPQKL
jgi:hypothetical protein